MKWCSHQSRLFARPTTKKTWESGYPSVPASNWKTDVPEFLRMLIVCCSCSRYFFEDAPSGSVCTLEKVWAQTFHKYKNANHHRVQKHRTKSLRAFVFPSESSRSGNTHRICTRFWTPRKQTNKYRRLFIAKLTLTRTIFGCLKHCSQLLVLFLQGFLWPNTST